MTNLPSPYQYTNSVTPLRARLASGVYNIVDYYVSRIDLEKTHRGICFANYQGYFLNVGFTINWAAMGYTTWEELNEAYEIFIENLRKQILRYKIPYYLYTVFEWGITNGCHSHSGVHVPALKYPTFRKWLNDYISRVSKKPAPNVLHLDTLRADPTTSQWKWFAYVMKGLDPRLTEADEAMFPETNFTAHALFGVRRFEFGGYVPIQRVRRSRSMMTKAQRDAGYEPAVDLYNGRTNERYSSAEYRRGIRDRSIAELHRALKPTQLI